MSVKELVPLFYKVAIYIIPNVYCVELVPQACISERAGAQVLPRGRLYIIPNVYCVELVPQDCVSERAGAKVQPRGRL